MSVTRRRFADEEVTEEAWHRDYDQIVAQINRKVFASPQSANVVSENEPDRQIASTGGKTALPRKQKTFVNDIQDFNAIYDGKDDSDSLELSDEEIGSHGRTDQSQIAKGMLANNSPIKAALNNSAAPLQSQRRKYKRKKTVKASKKQRGMTLVNDFELEPTKQTLSYTYDNPSALTLPRSQ